jgi:hypothetical protein
MKDAKEDLIKAVLGPGLSEERLLAALKVLQDGSGTEAEGNARFLSDKEAREYCGHIARSTLRRWRSQGLRSHRVGGRRLYRTTDLNEFVVGQNRSTHKSRKGTTT